MANEFIKVAIVEDISDPYKAGTMSCHWPNDPEEFPVHYTTPFYSPPEGNENSTFAGMYAVPTEGSNILVARAWNAHQWFYLGSIPGINFEEGADNEAKITGVSKQPYTSTLGSEELTELSTRPWGVMMKSSGGAKLQINDSASEDKLGWRTTLQSMTKKILLMADNGDFQTFQNEHNDGLIITGDDYTGINGPRSSTLETEGNLNLGTRTGNISIATVGGSEVSIENSASNYDPFNPNEGQVNITSYSNSVNISTKGVSEVIQNPLLPKGIFIDASNFMGVVQIRAGSGGLQVFSAGNIDFNCGGNFNINAAGHVNISGGSILSQSWAASYPPPTPPPGDLGLVELNPVIPMGLRPELKTLNNEEQWPSVPI